MKPYYEHAGIVIFHGDCREILPTLEKRGLLCTDPPYGLGIAANPFRQAHVASTWDDAPISPETTATLLGAAGEAIIWGGNFFPLPPAQCFFVWDKCQPENFSSSMCEIAWSSIKSPAKLLRLPVRPTGNDGYIAPAKLHPTQKPVELMRWCMKFCPDVGVVDPFMGSGTTLIAAKDLGRTAVGIETSEEYCEIAAKRLSQEVFQF